MLWTLLLASSAQAGPLLLPDPDEMGLHRCRRYPVAARNNVEVGSNQAVTDGPPGAPTYPAGLASGLVPRATDTDLKKAGKGKRIEALPSVTSLALEGRAARLACEARSATDQDFFTHGCNKPLACDLVIRHGGELHQIEQRDEVGAELEPITSAKRALGLVALLDPAVFLPMSRDELEQWTEDARGYRAIEPAMEWVQIEEEEAGFVVRAPRRVPCGCEQDVVRRAWWVSRDGRSCQLEESPVVLAKAVDVECEE